MRQDMTTSPKTSAMTAFSNLPRHPAVLRSGSEPLRSSGRASGPKLLDYWRWSASQLLDNTQRGTFAEYLVALALEFTDQPRDEWSAYDAIGRCGVKVEVKSAAYRQNWAQAKPSCIKFNIKPRKRSWDAYTNEWTKHDPPRRIASVYVSCVLGTKSDPAPDPLDLDQWEFYILPTAVLDSKVQDQKTISLGPLEALVREATGRGPVRHDRLSQIVDECAGFHASRKVNCT